jgi:hypothetical protein
VAIDLADWVAIGNGGVAAMAFQKAVGSRPKQYRHQAATTSSGS